MDATRQHEDLSLDELTVLRERALSWLCFDKGLVDTLYPRHPDTPSLTPEQRCAHVKAVVNSLLNISTEAGRKANARTFTRDTAARLRRMAARLSDGSYTHRDLAKMSVLLESVWDDANTDLSDHQWARCSMRFDTALITLRVTYVLTYMRAECPAGATSEPVRKSVYQRLVDQFFSRNAPTDDPQDKHSHNFKALVAAWHSELLTYVDSDAFSEKLDRLQAIQKPEETASYVLRFVRELAVDHSWLLDAAKLDADVKSGALVPKPAKGRRGRKPKKNGGAAAQRQKQQLAPEPPEPEESSSFEPAAKDSDYMAEGAEDQAELEEEEDEMDYPQSRRSRRNDGDMVRRSLRVARAGVRRKQSSSRRARKGPERFSDLQYPPGRSGTPNGKMRLRKTRAQRAGIMDDSDDPMDEDENEYVHVEHDWHGGTDGVEIRDGRSRSSPRRKSAVAAGAASRTRGQHQDERVSRRRLRNEDDDVPLRESKVSGEITRLSQQLDPDSQTFDSTGLSDVDEVTQNVIRQRRLRAALEKVELQPKAAAPVADDDAE